MNTQHVLSRRAYYKHLTETDLASRPRVLAACKADVVFWINNFCWCLEPRINYEFPMVLFDYQAWAIRDLWAHIARGKGDVLIEKARDLGITWIVLYLFLHFWLFYANSNFLISSYREQEVDFQGNMSTLFPKLRFVLDRLPAWMLPKAWDAKKHATYMRIANPDNGSAIIGSAPVPNFGRSGRYKALFFDEFAQWEHSVAAYNASSRTSDIRIFLSTPFGRDNMFATLATDPENARVEWLGGKERLLELGENPKERKTA